MTFETTIGPSLNDLMNQKSMQQMQMYGIGQEAQLRNLQVQSGQEQLSQQNQLRDLFQNMQPGQDMSSLLPSLMKLGPQGIDAASKISTSLVAMQQMQRMEEVRNKLAAFRSGGMQPGMKSPMAQQPMVQQQNTNPNWVGNPRAEILRIKNLQDREAAWKQFEASQQQNQQNPQSPMEQPGAMSRQQIAQIYREAGMIDEAMKLEPKVKDWKPVNVNGQVKYMPLFEDGTTGTPTDAPVAEKVQFGDAGDRAGVGFNPYTGAEVSPGVAKGQSPDSVASNATARFGQVMTEQRARDTLAQGNKPQFGYRYKPNGDIERVPGGPADLKLQGALNSDTQALSGGVSSMDRLATASNELLNHPGLPGIYGLRGALPNVPGSKAADAGALLNTLKSQVGFGVLQDMRNNSKTGGALGAISDKEIIILQANLAALEKAQSVEQAQLSLKKIVAYTDAAKDRLRNAYNMKHGGAKPVNAPINPSGAKFLGFE